jgi:hypothetical protein
MAAVTEKMNQNTENMKSTTEGMSGVMTEIYDSGRQGAAVDLRNKQWDLLIHAAKPDEKAANAALFFIEFEFQLWSNFGRDTIKQERERLMQDAVCEFFVRLLGITHWAPEELDPFAGSAPVLLANPLKQSDLDNEKASFNALALTIEHNNRKQELIPETSADQLSMLSLIENALRAGKQIKEGKAKLSDFPAYVDLVLQNEELAVRLLRARHQMMGLAVLCQVTTMCRDLGEGAKYAKLGVRWDLDFSQLNESQVRLISFRLGEGIAARNFLAELGIRDDLDAGIQRVFSHGTAKNAPGALDPKAAGNSELAQAQSRVLDQLKDYTTSP